MKKKLEIQEVTVFHKEDEWLLCYFNGKLTFIVRNFFKCDSKCNHPFL